MNTFSKHALAALVLSAAVAAPALASVQSDVQGSIAGSGSNISVTVKDGVATLSGYGDTASRIAAERAALKRAGIDRVVNLVF